MSMQIFSENTGDTLPNQVPQKYGTAYLERYHPAPLINDAEAVKLGKVFSLLSDPTRLKLLHLLISSTSQYQRGICVGEMAATLHRDESTISHQLKTLRDFDLVSVQKVGRSIYYRPADNHVLQIFQQALQHIEHSTLE